MDLLQKLSRAREQAVSAGSSSGNDGAPPTEAQEWREGLGELTTRGLIYTARGARNVLACDRQYRITAGFKQKAAKESRFTNYNELYRRVTRRTLAL